MQFDLLTVLVIVILLSNIFLIIMFLESRKDYADGKREIWEKIDRSVKIYLEDFNRLSNMYRDDHKAIAESLTYIDRLVSKHEGAITLFEAICRKSENINDELTVK